MTEKGKFLLGYGKELSEVAYVGGPSNAVPPYSVERQQQRLLPMFAALDEDAAIIPMSAAPEGQVVAIIQLHPSALSRSAFPDALMRRAGLRLLGSKPTRHRPEAGRGHDLIDGLPVTDLFVAATRQDFRTASQLLMDQQRLQPKDALGEDFQAIESLRLMTPSDRVKSRIAKKKDELELVLHYNATRDRKWRAAFTRYAKSVDFHLDAGLEFQRRDLLFLTATASREAAEKLSLFTFVRAIRPLPEPRPLEKPKILRSSSPKVFLPEGLSIEPKCRMAIFDGGLPENHPFQKWARAIEPLPHHAIGMAIPDLQAHGIAVTSAALFGPLTLNSMAPRPFCNVDHFRVLGANTGGKKGLYRALALIDEVLDQSHYDLISLSIGPPEVIDDDTVTAWTTLLDDYLGSASSLGLVAIGNNGLEDAPECRVMPPADSVNALGVGACSRASGDWARAPYSAKGPGRSPGLIKPDVVFFGGTIEEPFLFAGLNGQVLQEVGTSFATPSLARMAAGMKAHFGTYLSPTAIKALLVHSAETDGHPRLEVGFGRVPDVLESMILCAPGTARILYQGKLRPGGMLRAPITIPSALRGDVIVRATACYSCQTDPNTPGDYTRAALDFYFRPNSKKFREDKNRPGKKSKHPATAAFFSVHDHMPEHERRLIGQKWNTVMHGEHTKRASTLDNPCFDIHYVARQPGLSSTPGDAPELHYALVVTLYREKSPDLYDLVVAEYPQLLAIQPAIQLSDALTT